MSSRKGKKGGASHKAARPAAPPTDEAAWWVKVWREPLALCLVPLIFLRPWLDGVTYPTDNFYFIWGFVVLLSLWATQVLLRGKAIRFAHMILLLAGFLAVALLTAFDTVEYDATYRSLIIWTGHLFLFIIATNGLRSRTAITIVLVAFVVTSLAESLWSLVHLEYVLPYVREEVEKNPRLLKAYFSSDIMNPELRHRLEVNRAFGSLLFPNALAAFILLGLPYAFCEMVRSLKAMARDARAWAAARLDESQGPGWRPASSFASMLGGGIAWIVVLLPSYFLSGFIMDFEFPTPANAFRLGPLLCVADHGYVAAEGAFVALWILFVVLLPLLVGLATLFVLIRYGYRIFADVVRVCVLPPLVLIQCFALWKTYSRGGFVALAGAAVFVALILLWGTLRGARLAKPAAAAAGMAVLLAAASLSAGGAGTVQDVPAPVAAAVQPPADEPAPEPAPILGLRYEGVNLGAKDMLNPASFRLRIGYWRTGVYMALDNLCTGVGLGGFGAAYPKYQRLGVGDVKTAHNDYLQALCETGVLGCLAFCAFWLYFVVFGALRLSREQDPSERWLLAGLYASVLAVLIHSLVDFDFFNPSLAFYAFLLAGVFMSRTALDEGAPVAHVKRIRYQVAAISLLVAGVIVSTLALRVYLCDFTMGGRTPVTVGNNRMRNRMFDTGQFFMEECVKHKPGQPRPTRDIVSLAHFIGDRKTIESFGRIHLPSPGNASGYRALRPDEDITADCFVVILRPFDARKAFYKGADLYLEELAHADAIYPYNPDIAAYFIQWYDTLARNAVNKTLKHRYIVEFLKWAEAGVERSPHQAIYREWYGKALLLRGTIQPKGQAREYYERGLAEYKTATELYPISVRAWHKYGETAVKFGRALIKAGDAPTGEAHVKRGEEALQRAMALQEG